MLSFNLTFWVTGAMQCFDFKSIVPTNWWTQNLTCQEKEILLKYLPDILWKGEECLEMVCNFSFMGTWMSILFKGRHKQNLVSSVHFIVLYRTHVIQDVMRHELFYNVIVGCFIIQDIEYKEEEGDWFAVLTGVESFTEENKLGPLLQKAQKSMIRLHLYNSESADLFAPSWTYLEAERFWLKIFQLVLHVKHLLPMEIFNMCIYS